MTTTGKTLIPARSERKKKIAPHNQARTLAAHAVDAVLSKKGRDVVVMDMRAVSGVADFFVVCTGDSELQIKAIADAVEERLKSELRERPWHREGYEHRQWVLIDYVDLVVHVFNEEKRAFYDLERLWGDAPSEQVSDEGSAKDVSMLGEPPSEADASASPEQAETPKKKTAE